MVNFADPTVVDGAPRVALPYGLFSVLTTRPEGDKRWINGVQWEALGCWDVHGIGEPDCEPDEDGGTVAVGLPKTFNGLVIGDATAFTVYGHFRCSPVGHTLQEAQDRATAHLLAKEEAAVERAFWTGNLGNIPNLIGSAYEVTNTGGSGREALGLLEKAIGTDYGSLGVIHMSRAAATSLAADWLLIGSGGQLRTQLGTPVVAGAGYPGDGSPTNPAAGSEQMFATPALFGYRSEIDVASNRPGDLLDREDNDLYTIAERQYLIGFDPCDNPEGSIPVVEFQLSP